jgi:hypothetical protein
MSFAIETSFLHAWQLFISAMIAQNMRSDKVKDTWMTVLEVPVQAYAA